MIHVHSFLTRVVENYWNVPSTQEFECVFPFKLYLLLLIFAFSEYFIHVIPVISVCKGTPLTTTTTISAGCSATVCYIPHLRISSILFFHKRRRLVISHLWKWQTDNTGGHISIQNRSNGRGLHRILPLSFNTGWGKWRN